MHTKRGHAILTVKSVDDEKRVITGVASTPTPDRVGDIVEPLGAKFALPMPLLWQHQHETDFGLNTMTPVWGDDNLLFISSGYNGGSRVLKLVRNLQSPPT